MCNHDRAEVLDYDEAMARREAYCIVYVEKLWQRLPEQQL
jgi:hypothetical protein